MIFRVLFAVTCSLGAKLNLNVKYLCKFEKLDSYFALHLKNYPSWSKVIFQMVKTIWQYHYKEVLYLSVAQILLEIQQNLWKCDFFNFRVFVKKCWYHYTKTLKMQKLEKVILFILNHISSTFWVTKRYYTSF